MSGLDPLAAALVTLTLSKGDSALELGIPANVLQAQLRIGDLLDAIVLPPQNGLDLIEILGQQIVAQLPPDVHPGERLVLQVTGFSGNQLYVRNLGRPDPQNPPNTVNMVLAKSNENVGFIDAPPTCHPERVEAPISEAEDRTQQRSPIAPPRAVFVAASVRQATPPPASRTLPVAIRAQVQNAVRVVAELLKAVRVPDTPFTRTAAAIAPQAPARIPSVLQRLEAALPKESADPRVATLKTLIAFTSQISPANEETLPAQIASYVSNVVEGAEPKMQQLLTALAAKATPHSVVQFTMARAHAAERAAAIEHDLKSVVLSLLRDPARTRTPALTQALNETLVTLTGTQFNALSNQTQAPAAFTLTLPAIYHEGGKPAQIRISRDGTSHGQKMDADNFHVAFVLDTANLGTVAIDLQTVGRAVKVDVKTEGQTAASRFAVTLDSLRSRLETLRYRVTSANASVVPSTSTVKRSPVCHREVSNDPDVAEGKRNLDLRA